MNPPEAHQDVLTSFEGIIKDIEMLPTKWDNQVKFKIVFIDATTLRVSEVLYQYQVVAYSYYHLDSEDDLIIGWDSAPHHKRLENFPYHEHVGKDGKIQSSQKMDLAKVLAIVQKRLLGKP